MPRSVMRGDGVHGVSKSTHRHSHPSSPFELGALEPRTHLSVTAYIRVLGKQTTIRAGQSVHVSALTSGSGKQSDVGVGSVITAKFDWNFGDSTPTSKYNDLPGFNAAHVYDTPGTYRLRLRVTNEAGESDTNVKTITVLPDDRRPIYVSMWGNDNNNGQAKAHAVKTIGRAMQLLGDDTKLLFRRGETFKIAYPLRIYYSNVIVGAYGPGKPPILQLPKSTTAYHAALFTMGEASHQVTIQDLALQCAAPGNIGDAITPDGTNIVIRNCSFRGFATVIMGNHKPDGLLAQDNVSGVTGDYFSWTDGADYVFLGNKSNDSVRAHNIRIYASRVLAYKNDLTNKPVGVSIWGLRVNDGEDIYWAQNVLHGAPMMVGPLPPTGVAGAQKNHVNNVVIEDNQLLAVKKMALPHDRIQVNSGSSNVMVRNNYIVANNATAIAAHTYSSHRWPGARKNTKRYVQNLIVVNNTATDGGTHGSFMAVYDKASGAVTMKNNLYVAPKLIVGPFSTSAVRILGRGDLGNFTPLSGGGGIDGNVWPMPNNAERIGAIYIGRRDNGKDPYVKPSQWRADYSTFVGHNDRFMALTPADLTPTTDGTAPSPMPTLSTKLDNARPVAGVFADIDGTARPTADGATWTAGAVQVVDTTALTPPPAVGSDA